MKLFRPTWIDEHVIYTIDIHPDGTKFATGGNCNGSNRVMIWNMEPLLSYKAAGNKSIPELLCQLDNHVARVTTVRWSGSGLMLASASVDATILLYTLSKNPETHKEPHEQWLCQKLEHSGVFIDITWSPHDQWLASCSMDKNVIVWETSGLRSTVAVLEGHTGHVKGVAWDPLGQYLASQSDDQSVKIWRTTDWNCEATIGNPFKGNDETKPVLRLCWSPDGLYLVTAYATDGRISTAQTISRQNWGYVEQFMYHEEAVSCVRFHRSIFRLQNSDELTPYYCLAIGSRNLISVYTHKKDRPLVCVIDAIEGVVLDLSWSLDRHVLLACSTGGGVLCLSFSDEELGVPISKKKEKVESKPMPTIEDMNSEMLSKFQLSNYGLKPIGERKENDEPVAGRSYPIWMKIFDEFQDRRSNQNHSE